MKYTNFKRYKLAKILKIVNLGIYNFFKILKNFNFRRNKLFKTLNNINFKRYNINKFLNYFNFKSLDLYKIIRNATLIKNNLYKNLNLYKINRNVTLIKNNLYKNLNLYKIIRNVNLIKNNLYKSFMKILFVKKKVIFIYPLAFFTFTAFLYLSLPFFYKYDKIVIENKICKNIDIICSIKGDVSYNFFPTPRIVITDFIITNLVDKNNNFVNVKKLEAKLSFKNLINKKKFNVTKIKLINAKIIFTLKSFDKHLNFLKSGYYSKPLSIVKSEISFYENDKFIASIYNVNLKFKNSKKFNKGNLKGIFLGDKININYNKEINQDNPVTNVVIKFINARILAKVDLYNDKRKKKKFTGNFIFKQNKNRLRSTFTFNNNEITFRESDIRNSFLSGKAHGKIELLPYFNFNLNIDLNGINFNKFYNFLTGLNDKQKTNLFKVNKKLNGIINLSSEKIYSKYDLVKSFESQFQFLNGNILINQLILNLDKVGAADITGVVNNEKKISSLKFEKNIFIDSQKHFYRKFGILNKKNISNSLFISGNLDLSNLKIFLKEVSNDKNFTEEDVLYFEKEFNNYLLNNGYESFFNFPNLKDFVKLIFNE